MESFLQRQQKNLRVSVVTGTYSPKIETLKNMKIPINRRYSIHGHSVVKVEKILISVEGICKHTECAIHYFPKSTS